jgi:cation transport ATPase
MKYIVLFSNAWRVHFLADFVVFIARLKKKGIKTVLLSGDREEAVATIAETVGIENDFV